MEDALLLLTQKCNRRGERKDKTEQGEGREKREKGKKKKPLTREK